MDNFTAHMMLLSEQFPEATSFGVVKDSADYAMSILERYPEHMWLGVLNEESIQSLRVNGELGVMAKAWFESCDPELKGYLPIDRLYSDGYDDLCSAGSNPRCGLYRNRFSVVYARAEVESMADPIRAIANECVKFLSGV